MINYSDKQSDPLIYWLGSNVFKLIFKISETYLNIKNDGCPSISV